MRVIAIREDGSAVAECAMGRADHANREPLHAARKGALIIGLDDQVQVIGLDGEVHDAKGILFASRDRTAHRLEEQPVAAEARQPLAGSHRDVYRMTGEMALAASVRHTNAAARWLATRPRSGAAIFEDRSKWKCKLESSIAHLE